MFNQRIAFNTLTWIYAGAAVNCWDNKGEDLQRKHPESDPGCKNRSPYSRFYNCLLLATLIYHRANTRNELTYFRGFLLVMIITLLLSSAWRAQYFPLLILFVSGYTVYFLLTFRINEVRVDDDSDLVEIIQRNYLGYSRSQEYSLSGLQYSYKHEAKSLRGGVKQVLNLYVDAVKCAELVSDQVGWSKDSIREMVYSLDNTGVLRRDKGGVLKDVEL